MINTTLIKFHLFDLSFTPYNGNAKSPKSIIVECIHRINEERTKNGQAIVLNRHEDRKDELPRNMFVVSAAYSIPAQIYKCKIALIRAGKIPTLVNKSNYSIAEFNKLESHEIAEVTNFYIDVKGTVPVVCCEFNSNGPRVNDIEYYFRQISSHKMLHISKSCKASIHMKMPIKDVLDSIKDVLKFEIKAKPSRLNYLTSTVQGAFISNMNLLANTIEPKSMKIDAFFRERGKSSKELSKKNLKAVSFVKKVLSAIQKDNKIAEDIDDFMIEFEREDGTEDVFNLLKGKVEIEAECSLKTSGNLDTKELFDKISLKFNDYLKEYNG
ncbi:hypothetical protein [Flavobacterium degerlachei]|jgi:hypothetical protein|uniref:Uncharacterized protein n=1 Tax=Flavobacterium degerlachei TaxID=229203 RepID=A0A1H3BB16_9FLAO|nr:hypothetical protein [Flavobacterium degerlachei]SDX38209.1 hypothetical protein SAMN05444338_109185 [Flavobacterium degerlachei]